MINLTTPADDLLIEHRDQVLLITLNRPQASNALSGSLCRALTHLLAQVSDEPEVRAVVLSGGNGNVFCAGADLKERLANPGKDFEMRRPILALWRALGTFAKPLVYAINGHALGGGFELVVHADAAIASSAAEFALPEVQWAGIPGGWATQMLPRLVGPTRARWLMLSGERLSAAQAERFGIVTEVVAPEQVLQRAFAVAAMLGARPAAAVAAVKEAVRFSLDVPLTAGVEVEDRLLQIATASPERIQRLAAFASGARPDRKEN